MQYTFKCELSSIIFVSFILLIFSIGKAYSIDFIKGVVETIVGAASKFWAKSLVEGKLLKGSLVRSRANSNVFIDSTKI